MSRRRLASLLLLMTAALILGDRPARATGNLEVVTQGGAKIGNRKWHANSLPVNWKYNNPLTVGNCNYVSTNTPEPSLLPNIQPGFDAWQNDPDSKIAFTYGGTTAVRDIGNDGTNVVTFCDSTVLQQDQGFIASTPTTALAAPFTVTAGGGCPAGQGILDLNGNPPPAGYCFPAGTYPAGTIIDGDIRFNTFGSNENTLISTNHTPTTADVLGTVTHEIGHMFGLSHDPIWQTVMFPFVDDEPASDDIGQHVLKRSDYSTSGRYYPETSYGTSNGSITGFISLDGQDADGVHVMAIDPNTLVAVTGRFSVSRFEDNLALGPEGPDILANGAGFYRIDGLPPGNYYVFAEYFCNDEFFAGRLVNRYNTTVGNSNVCNGNATSSGQVGAWLGFIPALAEFYNAGDSGNGGDGVNPGTAVDNSDVATLVSVAAGGVTSNINIAINIEPVNGQTAAQRQNPTTRTVAAADNFQGTDVITAFILNGGNNDYWAVKFPPSALPTPPFNVAEGLWTRAGKNTQPFVTSITFDDPNNANFPDFIHPVVSSAGRMVSGGPSGATAVGDFIDVRDQWNVTVTSSRNVWILMKQPDPPPGIQFITQGYFALVTQTAAETARVGNTFLSTNGGLTLSPFTEADIFYDLIAEADPPVEVLSASPNNMDEGTTGNVDITGIGFQSGATADFGPGITVNNCNVPSSQHIVCNITLALTGAPQGHPVGVKVFNPGAVFPTVGQVFRTNPVADSDLDGTPDLQDCAPLDNTLESPAVLVTGLDLTDVGGGSVQLTWDSQDAVAGSGTVYDIVTGIAGDLRPAAGYAGSTCQVDNQGDSPFVDSTAVAVGAVRFWILRAWNGCTTGGGTYGDSEIVPDPRDALDAGVPCP